MIGVWGGGRYCRISFEKNLSWIPVLQTTSEQFLICLFLATCLNDDLTTLRPFLDPCQSGFRTETALVILVDIRRAVHTGVYVPINPPEWLSIPSTRVFSWIAYLDGNKRHPFTLALNPSWKAGVAGGQFCHLGASGIHGNKFCPPCYFTTYMTHRDNVVRFGLQYLPYTGATLCPFIKC